MAATEWPWEAVPARAGRKRWSLDTQQHIIPTDQGDYVVLGANAQQQPGSPTTSPASLPPVRPRSGGNPLTPSLAPIPAAARPHAGSGPRLMPAALKPVPRPTANLDAAAQLGGVLEARQLLRAPGRNGGTASAERIASPPGAHHAARNEARLQSVDRLRSRVRKADSDLAMALAESQAESDRLAARQRHEEQEQLDAAIAASLQASGGARSVEAGLRDGSDVAGAPQQAPQQMPQQIRSNRAGKQPAVARSRAVMARVSEEASSSSASADSAAEETRQLEAAIAESLREEERRQADLRHEGEQVLYGIVDSLRHHTSASSGGGARPSELRPRMRQPPRDASAALMGREMAHRILEDHLVSGAGLRECPLLYASSESSNSRV